MYYKVKGQVRHPNISCPPCPFSGGHTPTPRFSGEPLGGFPGIHGGQPGPGGSPEGVRGARAGARPVQGQGHRSVHQRGRLAGDK